MALSMHGVTTLFWDVGGVILSNAWDQEERRAAFKQFGLDEDSFEKRHAKFFTLLEIGGISLDEYLKQTVFYVPRTFTPEDFKAFMFAQSSENHTTRALLDEITAAGRYLMATLNNESAELNAYRIREFQLKRNFTVFLTSCYLGVRKPDAAIYQRALDITQRAPEECIFIDDRAPNIEAARRLGIRTILFENPAQLAKELMQEGVLGAAA
jgi:putative hydrolase of the HAD superfamily